MYRRKTAHTSKPRARKRKAKRSTGLRRKGKSSSSTDRHNPPTPMSRPHYVSPKMMLWHAKHHQPKPNQSEKQKYVPEKPVDPAAVATAEYLGATGFGTAGFMFGKRYLKDPISTAYMAARVGSNLMNTWINTKPDKRSWVDWGYDGATGVYNRLIGTTETDTNTGSNLKGHGDYSYMPIQTNQIIKGSAQRPLSVNAGKDLTGDIYISHREFIGNVQASFTQSSTVGTNTSVQSKFTVTSYPINAAYKPTFPWLSQTAQNWVLYDFQGLVFEYRPTSGEFGNLNTNALGKVVMATQYDPDHDAFGSIVEMENYDYATACKPSEHMLHGVETKHTQRATNMLYTRTGVVSKDPVFTDLGNFCIATEGIPLTIPSGYNTVTTNIGELWVTYKVKLSRANLYNSTMGIVPHDQHIADNLAPGNTTGTGWWTKGNASAPRLRSSVITNKLDFSVQPQTNAFIPFKKNSIGCQVYLPSIVTANTGVSPITIQFPINVTSGVYKCSFRYTILTSDKNTSEFFKSVKYDVVADTTSWHAITVAMENCNIGLLNDDFSSINSNIKAVWPSGLSAFCSNWGAINTTTVDTSLELFFYFYVKVDAPGTNVAKFTATPSINYFGAGLWNGGSGTGTEGQEVVTFVEVTQLPSHIVEY